MCVCVYFISHDLSFSLDWIISCVVVGQKRATEVAPGCCCYCCVALWIVNDAVRFFGNKAGVKMRPSDH